MAGVRSSSGGKTSSMTTPPDVRLNDRFYALQIGDSSCFYYNSDGKGRSHLQCLSNEGDEGLGYKMKVTIRAEAGASLSDIFAQ